MDTTQFETLMLALTGLKTEIQSEIRVIRSEVQSELRVVRSEVQSDLKIIRSEMVTKSEMKTRFDSIDKRFDRIEDKLNATFGQVGNLHERVNKLEKPSEGNA